MYPFHIRRRKKLLRKNLSSNKNKQLPKKQKIFLDLRYFILIFDLI